jgi:hypothetical protein
MVTLSSFHRLLSVDVEIAQYGVISSASRMKFKVLLYSIPESRLVIVGHYSYNVL